jgi:polyribonucleotide nucleotidyltransferase
MLHYNFPPYCTGEVGKLTGVSRREIGHGNLAERALKNMIPEQDVFPYTIRVVSDILESNGSSSMATVCAGSLSLFDAGVPMKKAVAGIAMGLIKEGDKVAILTDILGDEDHLGDMDFKVAGTADGITACQMDIKIEGLSIDIMKTALEQARQARLYILDVMNATISKPRDDISPYAPRFTSIKIPTDMIGLVIGPGGETIRSIAKETNTSIYIEEDGTVQIASSCKEDNLKAAQMIESLVRKPEVGDVYKGEIKEIREGLGAIVEFLPKKTGLLHISHIDHKKINKISDILAVGDKIDVMLIEITADGKYKLSRKALLPKPAQATYTRTPNYPPNPRPKP